MLLEIELKIHTIACPDEITEKIKKISKVALHREERCSVRVIDSDTVNEDMTGFALAVYGDAFDDFICDSLPDTDFLLLNHEYDSSLIERGVCDILNMPFADDRLFSSVINLIRRCYYRRRYELRDSLVKSYYEMSDNMLWTKNPDNIHMDANKFLSDLTGKSIAEIEGRHEIDIYGLDPNDPGCFESDNYVLKTGNSNSFYESMPDKDNRRHHLSVVKSPWLDRQGRIVGTIGIGKDITELMNQQALFNTFINSLDYSIALTDVNNMIIQINHAFANMAGNIEVISENFDEILSRYFIPSKSKDEYDYKLYDSERGEKSYWLLSTFPMHDFWDEYTGNIHILQDVTTQRMQSKKIAEMLRTDPLTGVNNKAGMYDFFLNADTSCKASFFFINLDNFKYIYNSYGHETSDKYLKDIAGLIRDVVPDGVITRYSENEFFVMMPENLYEGQVRKRAKNLIDRASFITGYPDDIVQKCRVYIGALYDEELSEYIDTIVKKTEIAMFHAKESNSSRYYLSYGA